MKLKTLATVLLSACGLLAGTTGCDGDDAKAAPPPVPSVNPTLSRYPFTRERISTSSTAASFPV